MKQTLFLLIVMGQCCFILCYLYEYRYINKTKSWDKAREYCRKNYADLATVTNMEDVRRLDRCSRNGADEAWIGLNHSDGNRTWYWSQPGVEYNETEVPWYSNQSKDHLNGNCGAIRKNSTWGYGVKCCNKTYTFLCYNESTQKALFINETMKWLDAQSYCRENHTDLLSGQYNLDNLEVLKQLQNEKMWVWTGLFRDAWRWSDGSRGSFRNWKPNAISHKYSDDRCAVLTENGQWRKTGCSCPKKPFYCYDDKVILVQRNMTWEDALYYCREKYHDLVSITNRNEQRWVQEKAKNATTPYVWTGLRYTCTLDFWFWVSDEVVDYKNWDSDGKTDDCDMSGAMDAGGQHKWFRMPDDQTFNFFCIKKEKPARPDDGA